MPKEEKGDPEFSDKELADALDHHLKLMAVCKKHGYADGYNGANAIANSLALEQEERKNGDKKD